LTGSIHPNSTVNTNKVIPLLVPAAQNPKFAHAGLDAGYYAYKAGTRSIYYYLPNADPRVIAKDNQLMQTTVKAELIEGLTLQGTTVSRSIHVPVLIVLGQHDLFGCAPDAIPTCTNASVHKAEAPYYSRQACLQTDVVPNAGHDLNLQKNAPVSYRDEATWIEAFVDHHHPSCGFRSTSPGHV
jgi:pimeloyl-ACP methyl ester carboxylesterase